MGQKPSLQSPLVMVTGVRASHPLFISHTDASLVSKLPRSQLSLLLAPCSPFPLPTCSLSSSFTLSLVLKTYFLNQSLHQSKTTTEKTQPKCRLRQPSPSGYIYTILTYLRPREHGRRQEGESQGTRDLAVMSYFLVRSERTHPTQ